MLVEQTQAQLSRLDIDALLAAGNIEEYIAGQTSTPFPLVQYT